MQYYILARRARRKQATSCVRPFYYFGKSVYNKTSTNFSWINFIMHLNVSFIFFRVTNNSLISYVPLQRNNLQLSMILFLYYDNNTSNIHFVTVQVLGTSQYKVFTSAAKLHKNSKVRGNSAWPDVPARTKECVTKKTLGKLLKGTKVSLHTHFFKEQIL